MRSAAAIHGATVTPRPFATKVRIVSSPSNSETGALIPSARHSRASAIRDGSPSGDAIQDSPASSCADRTSLAAKGCLIGSTATSGSFTRWWKVSGPEVGGRRWPDQSSMRARSISPDRTRARDSETVCCWSRTIWSSG